MSFSRMDVTSKLTCQFFIDPVNDIASIFTTQVLPGSSPVIKAIKKQTEQTLYRELADHDVVGTLYCYSGERLH